MTPRTHFLADSLTIRAERSEGGVRTTLLRGGTPVRLDAALLDAVLGIAGGREMSDQQVSTLVDAGILQLRQPFVDGLPERLALVADMSVSLDLSAPRVQLTGGRSTRSRPGRLLDLFVPGYRLAPLVDLHRGLVAEAQRVFRSAMVAARSLSPDEVHGRLVAWARDRLAADFSLQAVVEDTGGGGELRLEPLVRLAESEPQYELRGLRLQRPGMEPVVLPIDSGWAGLAGYSQLMGDLAAGASGPELGARYRDRGLGRVVLELLGERLLFEPPGLDCAAGVPSGTVLHVGGPALLCGIDGRHVWVDPVLERARPGASVLPLPPFAVPPIQGAFFTRAADLRAETLMLLPSQTTLYVPALPDAQGRVARIGALFGFARTEAVRGGEEVPVGAGSMSARPASDGVAWEIRDGDTRALALGHRVGGVAVDERVATIFGAADPMPTPPLFRDWSAVLRPSSEWLTPPRQGALATVLLAGDRQGARRSRMFDRYRMGKGFDENIGGALRFRPSDP